MAVSLSTEGRQIFDSSIDASRLSYVYSDVAVETYVGVDFIVEDCCDLTVDEQFVDGVIFDKSGGVVGFNWTLSSTKGCVVMPVYAASAFLDDVAWEYYQEKTYSPVLVGKLAGVDYVDIYCHMQVSKSTTDQGEVGREEYFYFSGEWMPYTEAVQNFYRNEQDGVLLIKDFAYKEAEIAADNRIVSVKINSNSYTIETRHDLIDVLYKIYTGDNVTFDFVSVTNSTAGSVTFMA
ncbi:MAG: hypothetical protein J6K39_00430 [Clostridia bacterium]|nr:hypothetical protein [Clostridia bacterium]